MNARALKVLAGVAEGGKQPGLLEHPVLEKQAAVPGLGVKQTLLGLILGGALARQRCSRGEKSAAL